MNLCAPFGMALYLRKTGRFATGLAMLRREAGHRLRRSTAR